MLTAAAGPRGYRVLVGSAKEETAAVVTYGAETLVTRPANGLLLTVSPEDTTVDDATRARYGAVDAALSKERIVAVSEIQEALHGEGARGEDMSAVLNPNTRHSVVFEPKQQRLRVVFTQADGTLSDEWTISLKEGQS